MIKIMSKKRYDELEQKFVDLQCDLNKALDDNDIYYHQVELLLKDNKAKDVRIKGLIEQIDELRKKEVKPIRRRTKKEVNNGEENNSHR